MFSQAKISGADTLLKLSVAIEEDLKALQPILLTLPMALQAAITWVAAIATKRDRMKKATTLQKPR